MPIGTHNKDVETFRNKLEITMHWIENGQNVWLCSGRNLNAGQRTCHKKAIKSSLSRQNHYWKKAQTSDKKTPSLAFYVLLIYYFYEGCPDKDRIRYMHPWNFRTKNIFFGSVTKVNSQLIIYVNEVKYSYPLLICSWILKFLVWKIKIVELDYFTSLT